MTWQCKLPLGLALLALLSGCASNPPPSPLPQQLAPPPLSAADISKAEQHAYAAGYAAGRRYQKSQDAQNPPGAPAPGLTTDAPPAAPPPPVPVQPAPPPAERYSAKGPAKPVATPLN